MNLHELKIEEIVSGIKQKKFSALEVTKCFLSRTERLNKDLNAVISINEKAEELASLIDKKIKNNENPGVLAGVPIGIKDMICTKGIRTTAASKILENFVPPYDATLVEKLKKEGAIIISKLNQDEFAMGSSNETSYFGPTKNPWSVAYVPGGSSGGSAAAVASRLAAATIGTDTGGSIRQPASYCGLVGVKPTYGRVSRFGVIAYASSLDQAGPMASSVYDAASILSVMCGYDDKDSTSSTKNVPDFKSEINGNIKNKKIGIVKEYLSGSLDPDVESGINKCISALKNEGAEIVEISLPLNKYSIPVYYIIAASEASSNLSRYDGVRFGYRADFKELSGVELDKFYSRTRAEGFGKEVQRRIMLGTYCLSSGYYDAYYNKAAQARRLIRQEFLQAFTKCDVILTPVATQPAFKIGERISDPLAMYMNDIFTTSVNLAGLPAMSVPIGLSKNRLPIGAQLISSHFDEVKMLSVAKKIEEIFNLSGEKPNVY